MAAAVAGGRLRPIDYTLLLVTLVLVVVGTILVFSATFPTETRPDDDGLPGDPYARVRKHVGSVMVGLGVMLLLSRARPRHLERMAPIVFIVALGLLALVHVEPLGQEVNGAKRWLWLPPLPRFQPSVVMKLALTVYLASLLVTGQRDGRPFRAVALRALMCTGAAGALVLLQPDLGTTVVLFGICLGMLFLAGMHPVLVALMTAGGAGAALAFAKLTGYGWDRIIGFWDPVGHAKDQGFHVLKMLGALARGGLFGSGLGQSPDKWFRFPARHTDSIYCILGGEFGLLGCVVLLILLGVMGYRVVLIATRSRDPFAALLAGGLGVVLLVQALVNIAVATKLLPCTGLTLPFLSYGGTSIVISLAAVGLLLALSRHAQSPEGG
jgi:cell division protein FtsW